MVDTVAVDGGSSEGVSDPGLTGATQVVLWAGVAVYVTVSVGRSVQVGVPFRDPGGIVLVSRITSIGFQGGVLAVIDVLVSWALVARRGEEGVWAPRGLLVVLRRRWPGRRVTATLSLFAAYLAVYFCYRNLKSWDAFNTPRDQDLSRVDRALFLGHSPAVLLHDLLGQHTAAVVLAAVYGSFTYLVNLSVSAALVLVRPVRRGFVFVAAAVWVWILGSVSYYLVPSLGPFASSPGDFTGLSTTAVTGSQAGYLVDRAQLLTHPGASGAFSSVSAFASLHVAFTCTVILAAYCYGYRSLAAALTLYLIAIVVSTIYLGMHFVVDDVAGLVIAVIAVTLGRITADLGGTSRPNRSSEAAA